MGRLIKFLVFFFSALLLLYVALPQNGFPTPLPDSLQSDEPADSETPLRRAYFTDYTRAEVMDHYRSAFTLKLPFGMEITPLRLNYPPEEAGTIIRDQTRSTYLEELAFPMREGIYVNGFEPSHEKDAIHIKGRDFEQKITVRYVPSNVYLRVVVCALALVSLFILAKEYMNVKKRN